MKKITSVLLAAAALAVSSCSVPAGWSVDGEINGVSSGTRLALEKYGNGRWTLVDSLTVGRNGTFGYDAEQPAHYAEIMRITLPGTGSIYFPVDSADAIIIEADSARLGFARVFGTPQAEAFSRVDSLVCAAGTVTEALQRQLIDYITADTTGIVAYYTVTKSIGAEPVFNPTESLGNRVYGAAAQVYAMHRPGDPRGDALTRAYFVGRQVMGKLPQPEETVVEVPETGLLDIVRYDYTGTSHSLAEMAQAGTPVILSFTSYELPTSPQYNLILNDLYNRFHERGLQIYQLAFDENEATWKDAARNLPWTTVWNSPADGMSAAVNYNVGAVPVTYLINNGEIVRRIDNPSDITAATEALFR